MGSDSLALDAVILGGGASGLWLLDDLHRRGFHVLLLESQGLGHGQTIGAQGIIHGGLKYALGGLLTRSAREIREMPGIWRGCLEGSRPPDLTRTRLRASHCHLWRTTSLRSQLGILGAQVGLSAAPVKVTDSDRPPALASCPGDVFRIDEPVIDPITFVRALAEQHEPRLLQVDAPEGVRFQAAPPGCIERVELAASPPQQRRLELHPRTVIFVAGQGNAGLREQAGLPAQAMQRRPLHMGLLRGPLPVLNGHCVDMAQTRVTITTTTDAQGRIVWQVGGQIAENGVKMQRSEFVDHLRSELLQVLPGIQFQAVEWSSYRVDRAEGRTADGSRPDCCQVIKEGNVITGWPTKLALVPQLSARIRELLGEAAGHGSAGAPALAGWPRPEVALPPWETEKEWLSNE